MNVFNIMFFILGLAIVISVTILFIVSFSEPFLDCEKKNWTGNVTSWGREYLCPELHVLNTTERLMKYE